MASALAVLNVDTAAGRSYPLPMEERTELALLEQARNGHAEAFSELVQAHTSRVLNLAYRLVGNRAEAEEIAQEAFLRLHRALPGFRGESRLATWLYRTTSRLAIDHLRRETLKKKIFFFRSRDKEETLDPLETAPDPGQGPAEQLLDREAGRRIGQAMKKLSPQQRAVFTLRHYEDLPLKQIAEMLGLQEGTVKVHLHRAVLQLRRELADLREVSP